MSGNSGDSRTKTSAGNDGQRPDQAETGSDSGSCRKETASGKHSAPDSCRPLQNLAGRSSMLRLADFLFEAGMLRKTPRSGYQFLGSGKENVAEHSFRAALIAFVLAELAGANAERAAVLCLVHDFHEARTGDFNYVNSIYNSSRQRLAMEHAVAGTGLEQRLLSLWDEQDSEESPESRCAADADQIDLILNLVEEKNLGNPYADKWLTAALARVRTIEGQKLAKHIVACDHSDWWFLGPDKKWWVDKGRSGQGED